MEEPTLPVEIPDDYVILAAEVFKLLSDPTRIRVVLALKHGELSVNSLAEAISRPATTVSQHLAKLRMAHVVRARQEGTRVYYSLVDEHARTLVDHALFQAEHAVEAFPPHHLRAGTAAAASSGQEPTR